MSRETVSQFWLHPSLDPVDFVNAFHQKFPGGIGIATHIPMVPDAHPPQVLDGSHFFEIHLATERMPEYSPFLEEYAKEHGMDINRFPASGFGFAHSG